MAPRGAAAPIFIDLKIDGDLPIAEFCGFTDMLGTLGGVDIVTNHACPSFPGAVHMHVVEVFVAVSEICGRGCSLFEGKLFVMAFKTETILLHPELCIKLRGECLSQHPPVI